MPDTEMELRRIIADLLKLVPEPPSEERIADAVEDGNEADAEVWMEIRETLKRAKEAADA
jgi:hypothetical protein